VREELERGGCEDDQVARCSITFHGLRRTTAAVWSAAALVLADGKLGGRRTLPSVPRIRRGLTPLAVAPPAARPTLLRASDGADWQLASRFDSSASARWKVKDRARLAAAARLAAPASCARGKYSQGLRDRGGGGGGGTRYNSGWSSASARPSKYACCATRSLVRGTPRASTWSTMYIVQPPTESRWTTWCMVVLERLGAW
jgi:hypothetical protein